MYLKFEISCADLPLTARHALLTQFANARPFAV
jgi:hypothetical protein